MVPFDVELRISYLFSKVVDWTLVEFVAIVLYIRRKELVPNENACCYLITEVG